jgi:hypothetical protein
MNPSIYRDARDRRHFLQLLEQWVARFRLRLHPFVPMDTFEAVIEAVEKARGAKWRSSKSGITTQDGIWCYTWRGELRN